MQGANRFALKEWAVVCQALAEGRQSLILRKGGIHEGRQGFQAAHREFWLLPTRFHQAADEIIPEARPLLARVQACEPPPGTVRLGLYCVVDEVVHIDDESALPHLAGRHIWSDRTVAERLHYRAPGLFALLVRVYALPEPLEMPDSPHLAGCRSWVDFPAELPTSGLTPVLDDAAAEREFARIRRALAPWL